MPSRNVELPQPRSGFSVRPSGAKMSVCSGVPSPSSPLPLRPALVVVLRRGLHRTDAFRIGVPIVAVTAASGAAVAGNHTLAWTATLAALIGTTVVAWISTIGRQTDRVEVARVAAHSRGARRSGVCAQP